MAFVVWWNIICLCKNSKSSWPSQYFPYIHCILRVRSTLFQLDRSILRFSINVFTALSSTKRWLHIHLPFICHSYECYQHTVCLTTEPKLWVKYTTNTTLRIICTLTLRLFPQGYLVESNISQKWHICATFRPRAFLSEALVHTFWEDRVSGAPSWRPYYS